MGNASSILVPFCHWEVDFSGNGQVQSLRGVRASSQGEGDTKMPLPGTGFDAARKNSALSDRAQEADATGVVQGDGPDL